MMTTMKHVDVHSFELPSLGTMRLGGIEVMFVTLDLAAFGPLKEPATLTVCDEGTQLQ